MSDPYAPMTSEAYARIENGQLVGCAVDHMRDMARSGNPFGYVLRPDDHEWALWCGYFRAHGMRRQLRFMQHRGHAGYMVPRRRPTDFDFYYRPMLVVSNQTRPDAPAGTSSDRRAG